MAVINIDFLMERHNFDKLLNKLKAYVMPQILGTPRRSHGTKSFCPFLSLTLLELFSHTLAPIYCLKLEVC